MIEIGWEQKVYPAAKIAVVVEALAAEGAPAEAALRGSGLEPAGLNSPTTMVSVDQVLRVYRNALGLTSERRFAFDTGLRTHLAAYGMYGFAILSSMNFRETMQFAIRYHQLATPLVKLRFVEQKNRAIWTIEPIPHPSIDARLYRFIVELQFGVHVSLHRDVMGSAFRPTTLAVTFKPPEPEEYYSRALGCPVAFEAPDNRFEYDADWLDGTPQLGNEISYSSVLSLCDGLHDQLRHRAGVAGKVREFLLATLGRHTRLEDVAAHFHTPVRTLRRKMSAENTSFRELLDGLRAEVAMKYLRETRMTVEDIAHAIGFSETANFRHAFRRWKQTSPQEFRRSRAEDGDA